MLVRCQVVLKLIQPYTRIRIPFVSQQLNIPEYDVEQLLVALILDSRIQGHIDQVLPLTTQWWNFLWHVQDTIALQQLKAMNLVVACAQVNQLLELESVQTVTTQKYKAIDKWSQHLHSLHQGILNKMS